MGVTAVSPDAPLATEGFLSPRTVAQILGYKSRMAFWAAMKASSPPAPFVRISPRKILFPERALKQWLASRSNLSPAT